jgi:replicative DNA helicase
MKALLDHDPSAEQGVILCLMASPREGIAKVKQSNLGAKAFCHNAYSSFIDVCERLLLAGFEVNEHSINGRLLEYVAAGNLSENEYKHLIGLWHSDLLLPEEIHQHVQRVSTYHAMRQSVAAAERFIIAAQERPAKVHQLLPPYMAELSAIAEGATPENPLPSAILSKEKPLQYYPSGFRSIDDEFGGWLRGHMVVWGAPTGEGKTAVGCCAAANLLQKGLGCLYFSPEVKSTLIINRIMCNLADITYREAMERHADNPVAEDERKYWETVLDDSLRIYHRVSTVADITMRIRWHMDETGFGERLGLVVLDHLHFISGIKSVGDNGQWRGNEASYWGEVTRRLLDAIHTHDIPFLLFAQLSVAAHRAFKDEGDLSVFTFKNSGEILNNSDIAYLMRKHPDKPNMAEVFLKKNRIYGNQDKYEWAYDPIHYRMTG